MTIRCHNDELRSELFILFAENCLYSNSLNFHVSGSPESISKQPTQLIVEFNSSLMHIIVTLLSNLYTVSNFLKALWN
jgi:hypothetical protein